MNGLSMWFSSLVYRKLLGTVLPVSWFCPALPLPLTAAPASPDLRIEIVSHCWQYAHLLVYQISSLCNYPPKNCTIIYTLYYAAEDENTDRLVAHFNTVNIPGVVWQWRPLPKTELFRRAIGRNRAALATTADYVWFTDCDTLFHDGCVESLASNLNGASEVMYYPSGERITALLESSDDMLDSLHSEPVIRNIDTTQFEDSSIHKAKGAYQIVQGEVCRSLGYCNSVALYQTPTDRWRKTFEDTVFRKLIRTEGSAINIDGLYRIRHIEKGRYAEDSTISNTRKSIRKSTD